MAFVQLAPLDSAVCTVVESHQEWIQSTSYQPFKSNTEICSAIDDMRKYGDELVFHFRSQFWKFDQNNQAVGDRRVVAFRFKGNATIEVDPGWAFDIIPVTGPVLLKDRLVTIGSYAHIDQTSSIQAVSPPREFVRHCWLYMYREDGKSLVGPSLQTEMNPGA